MSVIRKIKALWDAEETEPLSAPRAAGTGTAAKSAAQDRSASPRDSKDTQDTQIDAMIEDSARTRSPIMTGSIELLGLEDVKAAYGEEWGRVSHRVLEIAHEEIRRQTGSADFFKPQSETRFMICFGTLNAEEGAKKTQLIARYIKARLLEDMPAVGKTTAVKDFAAEVDASTLSTGTGSLTDRLAATLEKMQCEVEEAAAEQRLFILRDFQLSFAPYWEASSHLTKINRCVVDQMLYGHAIARLRTTAEPGQVTKAIAEFDCLIMTRAIERLHAARATKSPTALMIPVSWSTLWEPEIRATYLHLLKSTPKPYRQSIVLEVCILNENATANDVAAVNHAVMPLIRRVVIKVKHNGAIMPMLAETGIYGVSCVIGTDAAEAATDKDQLGRFVALAQDMGLKSFAHGANSLGLARVAVQTGFDFIGGTAIHLNVSEPRPAVRLKPMTLGDRREAG